MRPGGAAPGLLADEQIRVEQGATEGGIAVGVVRASGGSGVHGAGRDDDLALVAEPRGEAGGVAIGLRCRTARKAREPAHVTREVAALVRRAVLVVHAADADAPVMATDGRDAVDAAV